MLGRKEQMPQPAALGFPTIVQGSNAPVFRGPTDTQLRCEFCDHVLVDGYDPRSLIAIFIECFKCRGVTKTDSWQSDEPLPNTLVTLGHTGRFFIGNTVDVKDHAAFSTDQEIARVRGNTSPKKPLQSVIELSPSALSAMEAELNILTEGAFEKSRVSCVRAQTAENKTFAQEKFPVVWAIAHLREVLNAGEINVDGPDGVALAYLQIVRDCLGRWRHHPLFASVARSLCHEFHHSVTTFTVASYLSDHGNQVGITNTAKQQGSSPDLFININREETLSIEVKCPRAFFWPQKPPTNADALRKITKELRDARKQLTGKAGGVVVIGAGQSDPDFSARFKTFLEQVMGEGRVSKRIAAVVGVSYLGAGVTLDGSNGIRLTAGAQLFPVLNPRYEGENPVLTHPSRTTET